MLNPSEIFCKLQKKLLCIMLNINFPTPIFIDVLKKFQHKPNLILFPSSNHIHNIRRATTNQRKGKMEVSNPVEGSENVRQEKVAYNTPQDYFEKAERHLKEGDLAQASEKLFGAFEFALCAYVKELGEKHQQNKVRSARDWNFSTYRKLCNLVDDFLVEQKQQPFLADALLKANFFHIYGWRLNNLEFDDVDRGIKSIRGIVEKIKSLPTDREIIEGIEKKIFGFDVDSIVESIHHMITIKKNEWQAIQLWINQTYKLSEIRQIFQMYKDKHQKELTQIIVERMQ